MNEDNVMLVKSTWTRHDTYETELECKNRFLTAFNALFKGKIKISWSVPATQKRKGLYLKGERKWMK